MARGQIDNLANLKKLLMDPEEWFDVSNRSKVWNADNGGLKAGGRKDKEQSESCSIC